MSQAKNKGQNFSNEAAILVHEFHFKKRMAILGYQHNARDLNQFDAQVYALIDSTLAELDRKEQQRKRKKK